MSEGLKPWLLKYLTDYASTCGDLGKLLPKKGKVQILNFLSVPKTDEEFLWADLSDKEYIIPARFTPGAVKAFNANPFNAGRSLLSRRSAIAVINCKQPLRSKPPLGIQKGIDSVWKIVLEIDEVDVIACEGEARFGDPSELNSTPLVRHWLEGLGKGQGNIIKHQLNEIQANKKSNNKVETNRNGLNSKQVLIRHDSDFEKRYRQWKREIVALGMVSCFEGAEVGFEQSGVANASTEDDIQETTTPQRPVNSGGHPTTPSQWSTSDCARSSQNRVVDSERRSSEELSHPPSPASSFISSEYQNGEEDTELDVDAQNDEHLDPIDRVSSPLQPMPEAKVLVPDSDISHSQSQSLKLTQQADSQRSNFNHPMTPEIPQTSLEHYQAVSPYNSSARKANVVVPSSPASENEAATVDLTEDNPKEAPHPQEIPRVKESIALSDPFAESPNALQLHRGQKRRLSMTREDRDQGPSKRAKQLKENIPRQPSPLHDPAIWEKPSFMISTNKRAAASLNHDPNDRVHQPQNKPESADTRRKQTPEPNAVDNAATLKLGGWQPNWNLEEIPGVITYGTLFEALSSRCEHERKNIDVAANSTVTL